MPRLYMPEIYTLEMYNRHSSSGIAYCDLLVTDSDNVIYLANLIGVDSKVKQAAWLMQDGKTGQIYRAEGNRYETGFIRHSVFAIPTSKKPYDEEVLKVDDLTHILMVAKNAKPDLKARNQWLAEQRERINQGLDPESIPSHLAELILAWDGNYKKQVFHVLNDRYNTPMLEEWTDYIVERLEEEGYYTPLTVKCFGSNYSLEAGLLMITEEQLENIISEGVQGYELNFAIEEDGRDESQSILPHCQTIDDYLTHFAPELGKRIQENIAVRFDPEKERHHPAFRDVNLCANQQGITGLYPPQANTVMGVSKTLVEDDFCFIVGEMG